MESCQTGGGGANDMTHYKAASCVPKLIPMNESQCLLGKYERQNRVIQQQASGKLPLNNTFDVPLFVGVVDCLINI